MLQKIVFTWDPSKAASNLAKHGVSFEIVEYLDWETALIWVDTRQDYREIRLIALAPASGLVYAVVYTPRENTRRIISVRRASDKEFDRYVMSLGD